MQRSKGSTGRNDKFPRMPEVSINLLRREVTKILFEECKAPIFFLFYNTEVNTINHKRYERYRVSCLQLKKSESFKAVCFFPKQFIEVTNLCSLKK